MSFKCFIEQFKASLVALTSFGFSKCLFPIIMHELSLLLKYCELNWVSNKGPVQKLVLWVGESLKPVNTLFILALKAFNIWSKNWNIYFL